jgi:phage terminase large subunit-like protein
MSWAYKPEKLISEHEKRDRVPYTVWRKQGYITATPGSSIDYDWIAYEIGRVKADYVIKGLAFDRWGMKYLIKALDNIGVDHYVAGKDDPRAGALRLVDWGQGFKDMAGAVTALETSVLERRLVHDGNPVSTWCIANAMSISDPAGNRKLDKTKTRFRIDFAVACAMAVGLKYQDMSKEPGPSVYEERGIVML